MRRLALLALCAALAAPAARATDEIETGAQSALASEASSGIKKLSAAVRDGAVRVSAEAFINAPASLAFEALSDFESHPAFLPALSVSAISDRQGDAFKLEQVSRVSAGPLFSRSIRSIKRVELNRSALSIVSASLPESPSKSESKLTLSAAPGGCVLRYEAQASVPGWAPAALAEPIAASQARDQLSRMIAEIERRAAKTP